VGFGCGWAKLNVVFLCRQVRWQNTSFNFAKRWHFLPPFLSVYVCTFGRPTLAGNYLIHAINLPSIFVFGRIGADLLRFTKIQISHKQATSTP
jgi:hypothetical protein